MALLSNIDPGEFCNKSEVWTLENTEDSDIQACPTVGILTQMSVRIPTIYPSYPTSTQRGGGGALHWLVHYMTFFVSSIVLLHWYLWQCHHGVGLVTLVTLVLLKQHCLGSLDAFVPTSQLRSVLFCFTEDMLKCKTQEICLWPSLLCVSIRSGFLYQEICLYVYRPSLLCVSIQSGFLYQ